MRYIKYQIIIFIAAILFLSCSDESTTNSSKAGTYYGQSVNIGNGTARAWVKLDDNGNPVSIGFVFSESVLSGLPEQMTEYILMLPPQASSTAFNHIGFDWNPQGHEPAGIYDKPHFDSHFYMISQSSRDGITAQGDDTLKVYKDPGAEYLAPNYMIIPGTGVPRMGAHALDVTSPELNGGQFTETFIYGYYDGKMIFQEPMFTLALLQSKTAVDKAIKVPPKYPQSGYYPTRFSIKFDNTKAEYNVALDAMMMR